MITFNEIPSDWLEKGIYIEVRPNYRTLGVLPYPTRNLIIGQKLAAGTLTPGQIVEITRPEEAIGLFGRASIGAKQVAAFRRANKTQSLFVMAMADAGGSVKATGTFTFTGAVSAAIVLRFLVNNRQIRMTAAATDTVTQLATKLAAAINADLDCEVTAASAAGVVTCTARHGGEVGNDIDLRVDVKAQTVPSGLGIAVAAMSGGSGNPVLQDSLDLLGNTWFTHVSHPWSDATNMAAFQTWLKARYTATSKLDVHGFVGKRGTYGELGTWGDLTNCPQLTCLGLKKSPSSSWELSAVAHGLAAFHLTNDPARQLGSLVLPGIAAPDEGDQFTDLENDLLLRKGISTFNHLADGTTTVSRMVTTYKTSDLGVADRAWLDIMVPATLSRIRYDWSGYAALQYPRAKLVDDDAAALVSRDGDDPIEGDDGGVVTSPRRMHASWAARCALYEERVWIQNAKRTVSESYFEIPDDDKNRLNGRQQIDIVGNLMVLAGSLEFQV